MELKELKRKLAKLVADARAIANTAAEGSRLMTDEERTQFDALTNEAESIGAEIASRERVNALESAIQAGGGGDDRQGGDLLPHQESRNLGRYSLLRAICVMADRGRLDGLEGEVSQELAKRRALTTSRKLPANGFIMPYDLPIDMRSSASGRSRFAGGIRGAESRAGFDTTAGAGGIPTILDTTYIEILRNRMAVQAAGARVMTDMVGNFAIPRQSTTTTMYWLAEGGSPTGSQPTVDQVPFTPRTAGAYTDITRRLAEQINTDAEMFVREDLAAVVARGVDLAALNGSGASNQPLGILQNTDIPTIPIGTDGGPLTWAAVVGLETTVATANADLGSLSYMTNAKVRGAMKTTPKVAASPSFPIFLWNDAAAQPVNGYPCEITNQLPSNLVKGASGAVCSPMIFGDWSSLILAFWSGQDVIVDPYTGSTSGTLRIVTLQDVDINVRHPESFAKIVDITTP